MSRRRTATLVAVGAVSVAAAAAAVLMTRGDGVTPTYTPYDVDGGNRAFPMDTLDDVRAHSDAVVLATVLAEDEHESREAVYEGGSLVGRRITVRIDRSLWQKANAPTPPSIFETAGGSWSSVEGARKPLFWFGDVGEQYVMVVAKNIWDANGNSYEWMHEGSLGTPLLDGRTPTEIVSEKPYFEAIRGKTPAELEQLFAATLGG